MKLTLLLLYFLLFSSVAGAATVSDDFTRADNLDIGTNWDNGYTASAACQIVSNQVRNQAAGDGCVETWNANSFTNDQWAQITLADFNTLALARIALVLHAATPPTGDYYRITARINSGGATTTIQKFIANVGTTLATESAITWLSGDVLYAEISGTTITAKRNGVTIFTGTDAALASGRIGIYSSTDGALDEVELDSFSGGDLTTVGTTRRRVAAMEFQ
jgi:hypothetical protein